MVEYMAENSANDRKACMQEVERLLINGQKGTIIKIYLENFKYFNETFGYENGEQMLRDVADYLAEVSGRTVYRYVGVEFVIILENMMQGKSEDLCEEILNRFSHMWKIGDTECLAQAQIGMTAFPGLAGSPEELNLFLGRAVSEAVQRGLLVITGGPGTGKTTIINCILALLGRDVLLAAPTGRAAKRMSEATGHEAKTLHRLLEFAGDEGKFLRDEQNPLDCACVIVDEMSMVDVFLMRSLLRALRPGTRLIMVGDADQLPSVGAGNVLGDILKSGVIPSVRLTDIFRQSGESLIVVNAHRINHGEAPILNQKGSDFFFERRVLAEDAAASIVGLCQKRLPAFLHTDDPARDIQVLSPTKKAGAGVHQLNALLQAALNPPGGRKPEIIYGDTAYRLGDKVMHVRNNYQLPWKADDGSEGEGVFNGDVGFISKVDTQDRIVTVRYDDERTVEYDYQQLEELELAYCLSVHKSQGSEFPCVVMPVVGGPPRLLTRNLFYTALTRARKLVVLVGKEEAIAAMVRNNHIAARYTTLLQRLREEIGTPTAEAWPT